MKYIIRVLVACALLGLLAWAMSYISSDENSVQAPNHWGIAKDKFRK